MEVRKAADLAERALRAASLVPRAIARPLAEPSASAPTGHTAPAEFASSAPLTRIVPVTVCCAASLLDTAASRASTRQIANLVLPATPWPTAACRFAWMMTPAPSAHTAAMSDGRFATSATKTANAQNPPSAIYARVMAAGAYNVAKKRIAPTSTVTN